MRGDFDGLVAAVTGGASGIGAAVVLYSATKGAVLALTRAMGADHLAEGVRVNCVDPGAVAYLAGPRSGSTTGTSIAVDGGMQDLRLRPRT